MSKNTVKQQKPKMTPEEIAERKNQAESRKLFKDVQPALGRIVIALTDAMPHCSFMMEDNLTPETMTKRLGLIRSAGSSEPKYKGVDELVLLMMSKSIKSRKDKDPDEITDDITDEVDEPHSIEIGIYVPESRKDVLTPDALYIAIMETIPRDNLNKMTSDGQTYVSTVYVQSPEKMIDVMLTNFFTMLKKTGIYVEEESDDEDMGAMADAAGIEW